MRSSALWEHLLLCVCDEVYIYVCVCVYLYCYVILVFLYLQYVPPDLCICTFVLEQSLSVRALQEMLAKSGQNSEGVSDKHRWGSRRLGGEGVSVVDFCFCHFWNVFSLVNIICRDGAYHHRLHTQTHPHPSLPPPSLSDTLTW